MNKNLLILSILFISSCERVDLNSESLVVSNVDWTNQNTCSVSVDHNFIESIINKMTLEQKVGQIIMPDIDEVTPNEAKKYQLGTFLNGGGKFPNKNKNSSVDDWKKLSSRISPNGSTHCLFIMSKDSWSSGQSCFGTDFQNLPAKPYLAIPPA